VAITTNNIQWIGQPLAAAAQGQRMNSNDSGPLGQNLVGIVQLTLDGVATTTTLNFIDGTQKVYQNVYVLPVLSVAAPVTIGGVANQAVFSGVGSYGLLRVGQSVTFAGFTNAGNNGTFTINALTTSSIQVTNSSAVAETNPAGTVTLAIGPVAVAYQVARVLVGPNGVADTAASSTTAIVTAQSLASLSVTISSAGSVSQLCSFLVEIWPLS